MMFCIVAWYGEVCICILDDTLRHRGVMYACCLMRRKDETCPVSGSGDTYVQYRFGV